MKSTNVKIANASVVLIGVTILGAMAGLLKEMLVAKYFGISRAIDTFYAVLSIPNYITNTILSPLFAIFVPLFVQFRSELGLEEANKFAGILLNFLLIILGAASLFCILFSKDIIALSFKGFDVNSLMISSNLLTIISISIVLTGIITIFTSILNVFEYFFWPAVTPILVTLSNILFIVIFSKTWGVYVFAWGLIVGLLAQLVVLGFFVRKIGYRQNFELAWKHPGILRILKLSAIALATAVVSGFNPYFNRVVASWLPAGNIAAMSYADKIFSLPNLLFSGTIVTAMFPFMSLQAAENKIDELKHTLASGIKMSAYIFIPIAVTIMLFAKPLIELLFQRGAFNTYATELTSTILIFLSFQLFFSYSIGILQRVIFVFYGMKSVLIITIVTTVLNVILNLVLIKLITPPVAGIALASSIVCAVSAFLHFYVVKRRLSYLHGISILKSIVRFSLLAIISGGLMYLIYINLNRIIAYSFAFRAAKIVITVSVGFAFYGFLSFVFKTEESAKVFSLVKDKIREF